MKKIDHDARRQEIAQTAAQLIADQGIDKLTVRLIAKGMGCSTGVLSHYFNSKDDIVLAALQWANEWVVDTLLGELTAPRDLGELQRLLTSIMPLNEESDLRWRVRLSSWIYSLSRIELTMEQLERTKSWQKFVTELLIQLQSQGLISTTVDAELTAVALTNLIIGTSQNMLFLPMNERADKLRSIENYIQTLRTQ